MMILPHRKGVTMRVLFACLVTILLTACSSAGPGVDGTGRGRSERAIYPSYREILLEATAETSANISFGDLDRDGNLDIVLVKGRHWPLRDRILVGDGRGGIRAAYDLSTSGDRSYSGALADLNADGALDIVISNDTPDEKLVYLNDGRGRFSAPVPFGRASWETRNATIADVDGDGLLDVVVANRPDRDFANYVCMSQGDGRWFTNCAAFARYPATTIAAADLNSDGQVDLIVPHRDGGQSYVYLGDASGPSESRRVPFGPSDAAIRAARAGDFNRDGWLDIVAIDERTGASLYYGSAQGNFVAGIALSGPRPTPYALEVGDLDGDGCEDIVVGYVEAAPTIFFCGARGEFVSRSFGDARGAAYGIAIGDLNKDGSPDIGVARSDAPNAIYLAAR